MSDNSSTLNLKLQKKEVERVGRRVVVKHNSIEFILLLGKVAF